MVETGNKPVITFVILRNSPDFETSKPFNTLGCKTQSPNVYDQRHSIGKERWQVDLQKSYIYY